MVAVETLAARATSSRVGLDSFFIACLIVTLVYRKVASDTRLRQPLVLTIDHSCVQKPTAGVTYTGSPANTCSQCPSPMSLFKPVTVLSVALACSAAPASVFAEWTGGVEGGSVVRDGNNATRLRGHLSLNERPLSHYLYAEWYRFEENSIELGYKPRYWLTDKLYTFGDARVRLEKALGIDRDTLLVGGVGMQLVATARQQLWLEAGIGYRMTVFTPETGLEDKDEPVGTVRGGASQVLSDLFRLQLDGDVFSSPGYTQSQVEAGISMRIPQGAVKLSHRLRRTDIDGLEAVNDSETGISFTVGF